MNAENKKRLSVSAKEAAQMIGVSMPTMYELCHRADFPSMTIGKKIIIPIEGLEQWLTEQSSGRKEA